MGIRGDFSGLRKMQVAISSLASTQSKTELSRVLMQEALEQVNEGFATSRAPDDSPWAKLKLRSGQPLRDTRRLQSSFTGESNSRGFRIGTNVEYAVTHQEGRTIHARRAPYLRFVAGGRHFAVKSVTVPARPMVPDGSRLPPRWRTALADAAREYLARKLRR